MLQRYVSNEALKFQNICGTYRMLINKGQIECLEFIKIRQYLHTNIYQRIKTYIEVAGMYFQHEFLGLNYMTKLAVRITYILQTVLFCTKKSMKM
jgi:hypothetical protein